MRIFASVVLGLWTAACATPDEAVSQPTPVERSAAEHEGIPAPPSIEMTTGAVAGLHRAALGHEDPVAAAQMLERACDRGFAPSCVAFAERLEAGDGVEPDADRARSVLEQTCFDGSTVACDRIGH